LPANEGTERRIKMRLQFTIDIHRTLTDVFGVVGNLENDPRWQRAVTEAKKVSAGPIAEGTRFRHVVRLMGRPTVVDMAFLHFDRERRYVLDCVTGPLEFTTDVRFEPIARGTRMVTSVAGQPRGLVRLAAITLSNHRRHEIESDLHNLKRMMEARLL
jgi:hypothetical protein